MPLDRLAMYETDSAKVAEQNQELLGKHIVFYDGVCGLCNKSVQYILGMDKSDTFRFAPLQGEFAIRVLSERGVDATDLNTVYVLANFKTGHERLFNKSDAFIFASKTTRHWSRPLAIVFSIVPKFLRDIGYDVVARNRYRIFGKYDQCKIPSPEERMKFIEM